MNFIQHCMVRVLLVLCVRGTLCDVYIISLCKRCIGLMMTKVHTYVCVMIKKIFKKYAVYWTTPLFKDKLLSKNSLKI